MKGEGPDYRLRPAKHVERQLIVDGLRRLRGFAPLPDYSYIGFGAQYFVDFSLVHRDLGVRNMISLEAKEELYERCDFNKPFDSVEVLSGYSWDHFSSLSFAGPTIAWCDYTGKLDRKMLGDIDTLSLRLPGGSMILITVNASADEVPEPPKGRLELLQTRVGVDAVPIGTKDSDLDGWSNATVQRQIIDEQIRVSLSTRADGTTYEQVFHFHYRDGARMLTVGGVLVGRDQEQQFVACEWPTVEGFRPGPEAMTIELPTLTMREMAHLDKQLPGGAANMSSPGLSEREIAAYASFYRHYPRYARVDVS